jgi:translation initiation factor eIF-2B subunit alpha
MAACAQLLGKPFYVAAESYKFARLYPLSQKDISDQYGDCENENRSSGVDFTPAKFITLLFTDLGVLTPSAVSDELIRLYQ